MSNGFLHNAPDGINLDINETHPEIKNTAKYIKNMTTAVNTNGDGNTPQIAGNNQTDHTPFISTIQVCDSLNIPDGDNYAIGTYNDTNSKETYVHVWNSLRNHFIYKINEDGSCTKVYQGSCLNYQLNSENFIPQNRNELFYKCQTNLFTTEQQYIRDLVFTDGFNWQRFISVNDSINTNFFSGDKFKYSDINNTTTSFQFDLCEYIELIPRMPMRCIGVEELPNLQPQKNNFIVNKTWQFRIKFFDVWNRESEHGVISNLYVPATSSCQKDASGLPRCLQLKIEAGSPIVSKIQIEYRNCVVANSDVPATTDWFIYDVIDRYADCNANDKKPWYEREVTLPSYDPQTNTFLYEFCGEKECTPIPIEQTNRTFNPVPIVSGALARLGNGIALANNQVDYPPVDCATKDLLTVSYEPPVAPCEPKFCDIECWAVIHNVFVGCNEPVYNHNGLPDGMSGVIGGDWKWGGIGRWHPATGTTPKINSVDTDYGQTFEQQLNNQRNFYAYLEGTEFKVQAFQQLVDGGVKQEWGAELQSDLLSYNQVSRRIANGSYYVQHFVFKNVPLGKYIIRIAGHNNSMDVNYQDSSTYVVGKIAESDYISQLTDFTKVDTYYKELEVDTCSFTGDKQTITDMLMIGDLSCPDDILVNSRANVWYGYLKDSKGFPVELSPVVIHDIPSQGGTQDLSLVPDGTLSDAWSNLINKTDHNGFWFCACTSIDILHFNGAINFTYSVESGSCSSRTIAFSDTIDTFRADASLIPLIVSEDITLGVPDYGKCRHILVTGRVTDCNNRPIGGIPVCYTRSKSSRTNSAGYYNIIIHNDISFSVSTPLGRDLGTGPTDDKIFISQNGLCVFVSCIGCDMCIPVIYNSTVNPKLSCFDCTAGDTTQVVIDTTKIRFPFADQHGLKHGSTVKFGIKLFDKAGRHTFVGSDDSLNLYIPKVQQQLNQLFGRVKYTLTNQTFPSWVDYIGFYWTDQQAEYKSLEFIISNFDINVQTGKITINLDPIINYETDNNFKVNTSWEFQKGDRIEFIADESGHIFDANNPLIGLLNFQIEGDSKTNASGIIDFDKRLSNIKPGTLIQLQRPKECNNELFYYEICSPIKLVSNRIPTNLLSGYFDVWNSYLVSRIIRYGVNKQFYTFPFVFEHFAPSDFWGGDCGNRGRVNTINPYAQQYCKPMAVILSDSYSTNINGLSYFSEDTEHTFDDSTFGSITAMIVKLNYVLFICAQSSFVTVYDDQTLRVDAQGRVFYTGGKFAKPNLINKESGCTVVDISTISKLDGLVMFYDRYNRSMSEHNFQEIRDVSENVFKGYLITKTDTVINYNKNAQRFYDKIFIGCFDPEKSEYVFTQFDLPKYDSAGDRLDSLNAPSYLNTEVEINEQVPETFSYSVKEHSLKTFCEFTPENYSIWNNKLISFKQSIAFNHGIRNTNSFNIIYGQQAISVFDFVCNADTTDLIKFWQWLEIRCKEVKWSASKIVTQQGQLSEIPLVNIEVIDDFMTSEFLCDINTFANPNIPSLATAQGRLYDGDTLKGTWIRIKLISDTSNSDAYFEFTDATVFAGPVQQSGNTGQGK